MIYSIIHLYYNPPKHTLPRGIGFYSLSKKINNLEITAGNFYDQFGSGIIFRGL